MVVVNKSQSVKGDHNGNSDTINHPKLLAIVNFFLEYPEGFGIPDKNTILRDLNSTESMLGLAKLCIGKANDTDCKYIYETIFDKTSQGLTNLEKEIFDLVKPRASLISQQEVDKNITQDIPASYGNQESEKMTGFQARQVNRSNSINFANLLSNVQTLLIDQVNRSVSSDKPKLRIEYNTDADALTAFEGPVALLMEETHFDSKDSPESYMFLREMNASFIEKACENKELLCLGDALVEGCLKPRPSNVDKKIRTVYQTLSNKLSPEKLIDFHAGESFEASIEQVILASLISSYNIENYNKTKSVSKEDLNKGLNHILRQIGNSIISDDSFEFDSEKIKKYGSKLNEVLNQTGLKDYVTLENLHEILPEVPDNEVKYPKFKNLQHPSLQILLMSAMQKLIALNKRFAYVMLLREYSIRDSFSKLGFGTHPMVIGCDHPSRMISILEDAGIPVIIVSARKGKLDKPSYSYENSKKEVDGIIAEYEKSLKR